MGFDFEIACLGNPAGAEAERGEGVSDNNSVFNDLAGLFTDSAQRRLMNLTWWSPDDEKVQILPLGAAEDFPKSVERWVELGARRQVRCIDRIGECQILLVSDRYFKCGYIVEMEATSGGRPSRQRPR